MTTQSDYEQAQADPALRGQFIDRVYPRFAKDIARILYVPEMAVSATATPYAKEGTRIYTAMRAEHDTKVALPYFIVGRPTVRVFEAAFAPEAHVFVDDFLSALEHERIHAGRRRHPLTKLEYILKTPHKGDPDTTRLLVSLIKAVDEVDVYEQQFGRLEEGKQYSKSFIMSMLESQAAQKRKRDQRTADLRTRGLLRGEECTLETLSAAVRTVTGRDPREYTVVHRKPRGIGPNSTERAT